MASAPLNWLLKIGGDALQTTAQTISAAVNELKTTKMSAATYDPNGTVATAGGIVDYVDDVITDALTASY